MNLKTVELLKEQRYRSRLEGYKPLHTVIVFNDSHQSDGFEKAVETINKLMEKDNLPTRVIHSFIENYVSDEGEFACKIRLESRPNHEKE